MLKPYTVLDFTDERGELGPMLLGDLGADVIRVELPGGSSARQQAPLLEDTDDDLRSLQFIAFNRNKRSIVLDPSEPDDLQALKGLIGRADFIFESAPADTLHTYGIGFEEARALNDRIVYIHISAFGDDGPRAHFRANDLILAAMGGPVSLQGEGDRPPIRLSVPQVWRHVGAECAAGALVAHAKMLRSGQAQYVDLSAQCVMTWTMLNAMDAHAIQGFDFPRGGSGVAGITIVQPTADGHVVALPTSDVVTACLPWMLEEGVGDENLKDIDWEEFDLNMANPEYEGFNILDSTALIQQFFANHSKDELFHYGLEHNATIAPVNTLDELLALDHMEIRDYWEEQTLPNGKTVRSPGHWSKPSTGKPSIRRQAPRLNEHRDEILAELTTDRLSQNYPEPDDALPFQGIKVTDFAWVGVGPISSKYLADHGADVVRVESANRPDVLRGNGPFKDAEPGIDRSQFYGDFNTSKRSISLDMKLPEAIEIAKKLIVESDVMIESFAPGAITRMGLGYEEVSKLNPGLIMISTCLMGQTGPAAGLAGYGYHAAAMAGFYEVTGWRDRAPTGPWIAYTDTIAPRFVSSLLAAALDHRRRTGEGCYIDVAQIETALHFLGPELLDLQANGNSVHRIGNRSRFFAPQGCYPCAGDDRWCAVSVEAEEEWQSLATVIGQPGWIETYPDHASRLADHDTIDEVISAWTQGRDPYEVMETLQAAGVPAGVVQRSSDLLEDPQYEHRNFYRYHTHTEMGYIPYAGHQYRIQGYDNGPRGPAPGLGQHSYEVLTEKLEFNEDDIADAYVSGAIN